MTSGLEMEQGYSQRKRYKGEVNKKENISKRKRKQVIRETNTQTIYVVPKSMSSVEH